MTGHFTYDEQKKIVAFYLLGRRFSRLAEEKSKNLRADIEQTRRSVVRTEYGNGDGIVMWGYYKLSISS